MHWLLLLTFIVLTTNTYACNDCTVSNSFVNNVTLTDPAKYKLIYTGIEGFLMDEYVRAITRKWSDDIELRYNSGDISTLDVNRHYRLLSDYRQDYAAGNYADNRKFWWHYQENWGPIRAYTTGPSGDVINIGPIRVNSNFRLKLKNYEAELSNRWKYRFRPVIRVSSKPPFIRVVAAGNQFTYKVRGRKLVRITVAGGYSISTREALFETQLELLNW